MRSIAIRISILTGLIILLIFMTASCSSCNLVITQDMTPAMYFYKAQDAAQKNCNEIAITYYQKFLENFPDNVEKGVWAQYEMAVLYHKMGNDEKALELLNTLLQRYDNNTTGEKLPEAPRTLARKVKSNIEKANKPLADTK